MFVASIVLWAAGCYRSHELPAGATDADAGCRSTAPGWTVETIDGREERTSDLALAVGEGGQAHLSYVAGGQAWYATAEGAPEAVRDRVQPGFRRSTAVAVGADGPHVAFFGFGPETPAVGVHHAVRGAGGWTSELVTEWGTLFNIVRDPVVRLELPGVVYRASADGVRFATLGADGWSGDNRYLHSPDPTFDGVLATDGMLHTVHVDVRYEYAAGGRLVAIHEDTVHRAGELTEVLQTTSWLADEDGRFSGRRSAGEDHLAIAVDGGVAHVVFGVAVPDGGTELRYARRAERSTAEIVLTAGEAALSHVSIAIGPGGVPHVAFTEDGALRVAVGREDGFEVEDVAGRVGQWPRVAVAAAGTIFVAFLDDGGVELARRPPRRCE